MLRQLVCFLSLLACLPFPTTSSADAPWMLDEWKLDHAINEESIQTQQPIKEASHPAGALIHPHTHPRVKSSEYFNKEALYRLNVVPCRVYIPPPGKIYHYATYVVSSNWQRPYQYKCYPVLLRNDSMREYDKNINTTYIESPGYPNTNYPSRRLSLYHVKCKGQVMFNFIAFNLQSSVLINRSTRECVDYVNITDGKISNEYCGNHETGFLKERYEGNVLVTFRSSKYNSNSGFFIAPVCSDVGVAKQELSKCVQVNDYVRINGYVEADVFGDVWTENLPLYLKNRLMWFHHQFAFQGGHMHPKVMSTNEAKNHRGILRMAVLSEHSCDAVLRVIGQEVTKLFPSYMLQKETARVLKGLFFRE